MAGTATPGLGSGRPAKRGLSVLWAGVSATVALLTLSWCRRQKVGVAGPQRLQKPPSGFLKEFERLSQELAHEIRNPLTAINARLYKLQRKLPPGTAEHRDALLIQEEIKRLDEILESFRSLRSPAAASAVEFKPRALFKEIEDLFCPQLTLHSIDLRCEPGSELEVRGQPQQLRQVLINLVKNAAESILKTEMKMPNRSPLPGQFSKPTRGTIVLRATTGLAELSGGATSVVIIEVEDDGPGIPPELSSQLLQPFFSTKPHGTGLGLPIAARLLAQQGGALELEHRPAGGAIFRVLLPQSS